MNITRQETADGVVLVLEGRLDAQYAGRLEHELDDLSRAGTVAVVLDLEGLDYLSSAGIRILLRYARDLKRLGGGLSVTHAAASVQRVLDLTGMSRILSSSDGAAQATAAEVPEHRVVENDQVRCTIYHQGSPSSCTVHLVGTPSVLNDGRIRPESLKEFAVETETLALGIGAFGETTEECVPRLGEYLSVADVALSLPGDGARIPDYQIAREQWIPHPRLLYALTVSPLPRNTARFEARTAEGVSVPELLDCLGDEAQGSGRLVAVILAESCGLVGAALRRSPEFDSQQGDLFTHPRIREHLRFTPERTHSRALCLVAGILASSREPSIHLSPFVRTLDDGGGAFWGHFHAAAFTYTALPGGPLPLAETVRDVAERQTAIDLLHLTRDLRPALGAGESRFSRGVVWYATATVERQTEGEA